MAVAVLIRASEIYSLGTFTRPSVWEGHLGLTRDSGHSPLKRSVTLSQTGMVVEDARVCRKRKVS